MSMPPDWQTRMVEMIRGAQAADGSWFAGGPSLTPVEQIEVYRNQYRLRLYDAVAEEVPGVVHLLAEQAEDTIRAYLADHPSESWTLNDVAKALVPWLEARGAPSAQVEMARLDRAVQGGFTAAPGEPIEVTQLSTMPMLELQPHVTLIHATHNIHLVRSAVVSGRDVPDLVPGDFTIVVFRRGIKMRHWVLDPAMFFILDGIGRGEHLGAIVERLVADGLVTPPELAQRIAGWFRDFSERNLVQIST